MNAEVRARLRKLASLATPGPWEVGSGDDYFVAADAYPQSCTRPFKSDDTGPYLCGVGNRPADFGEANATYIAQAHPGAILDLLDALETAERKYEAAYAALVHHQDVRYPIIKEALRKAEGIS